MSNGWDQGERAVYGDIGLNTIELQTWIRAKKKKRGGGERRLKRNRQASVPWGRLWNSPLQWNDSPFWCFHEALLFLDLPPTVPTSLPRPSAQTWEHSQHTEHHCKRYCGWQTCSAKHAKSAWECVRRVTGARECTVHSAPCTLARMRRPRACTVTLSISQIIKREQI